MAEICPGGEFQFIAHLPQWGLEWPISSGEWDGGLPSVAEDGVSTVWGAVFDLPNGEFAELDALEKSEGRTAETVEAMDRNGRRHQVTVHIYAGSPNGSLPPSTDYVSLMLDGSRHWSLPAGWIAGLEEHLPSQL